MRVSIVVYGKRMSLDEVGFDKDEAFVVKHKGYEEEMLRIKADAATDVLALAVLRTQGYARGAGCDA
jgi:hypothetical protein